MNDIILYMTIDPMDEQLKKELWKVLNLLRGSISADQYHTVLFLASLQREELLEDLRHVEPLSRRYELDDLIEGALIAHNEAFEALYDRVYKPIIDSIPLDVFAKLIDGIFVICEMTKNRLFADVFEEILSYLLEMAIKPIEFYLPTMIGKFASSLVDISPEASIYNPFAGLASFGLSIKNTQSYYGQEVITDAWAIGVLRLFAHESPAKTCLRNEDSVHNWYPVFEGKFGMLEKLIRTGAKRASVDLIISSPPFGYKLNEAEFLFGQRYYAETLVLDQGLNILSDHGKIVCLVSNGVLFRGGADQKVRKRLIDDDYLEMVISFPGYLLANTSIPFSIIVVNKEKKQQGHVKFIDATSFISRKKKTWTFAGHELLGSIKEGKESDFLRIVPNAQVEHQEYNLSVNRYFVAGSQEGMAIGELGEIFATGTALEKVGHLVSKEWLRADLLNYVIPNNFVLYTRLPDRSKQITESCFLIWANGTTLKVAYFKYEGIPFYIPQDVFPFRLSNSLINPDYFVYQLLSENIQKQVNAYVYGTVIPRLSKADFLRLKIDVPSQENVQNSLLLQESVVRGARNAYIHLREKEVDLEKTLLGLKDDATRNYQSMKHTFRQYLSSLKSNTLGTRKFLERNSGKPISLNMLYSKKLGQDLGTHLRNVDALIQSLSDLLEDAPEKGTVEAVNVIDFIAQFQKEFTFSNKFKYLFLIDDLSFQDDDSQVFDPIISINKAQFKKVLSNIVSNAIEHGFIGEDEYTVYFSLAAKDKSLILEIKNNGKPMTEGFGYKELTTRGEKTIGSKGTGLGGFDIKSIVESYGGEFDLVTDFADSFPVTYILKFPLISKQI